MIIHQGECASTFPLYRLMVAMMLTVPVQLTNSAFAFAQLNQANAVPGQTARGLASQLLDEEAEPSSGRLGETDEVSSPRGSLGRVGAQMAAVEQRIRAGQLNPATSLLQARIVQQLGELIEQAADQQQASAQRQSTERRRSPETPRPTGEAADSPQPAEQAIFDRPSLQAIWLILPANQQRQIRTPLHEEFLPAYRQRIVDYYQRLSERRSSQE